jgi:hypothetical protein
VAQLIGFFNPGPIEWMILLILGVLLFGRKLGSLARLSRHPEQAFVGPSLFWCLVCFYLAASCMSCRKSAVR